MIMGEFTGKVVLITGAGGKVGRAIALGFSTQGATVAANDINPINLDETVRLITQSGATGQGFVFDIAKRMPIEGLVAQVLENFGRIDILVNCASIHPDASILDMDEWDFHRTLDVNLGGPFFTLQQVGRVMRQQGGGVMVNIVYQCMPSLVQKGQAAYLASQAGLIGLTQASADELAQYNIRLNAICHMPHALAVNFGQDWERVTPEVWRLTFPEVASGGYPIVVGQTLFLCSAAGSSTTGRVFVVSLAE
jgi:3-oxoacyl-[acyl-carrier protein] reductase